MGRSIQIDSLDNVAVLLDAVEKGDAVQVGCRSITALEAIPAGHKIALSTLKAGDIIIKYGFPIGHVLESLSEGSWVNEKRIKTNLDGLLNYTYQPMEYQSSILTLEERTFQGYRRKNGAIGIRNELWIIPTVGCVNGIVNRLAEIYKKECNNLPFLDTVVAFPHNYGCSQLGEDNENTRKILRGMVTHPNAGGVLVVGLGCENNQVSSFRSSLGDYDTSRVCFMECQKVEDELEEGLKLLRKLTKAMQFDQREDCPLSELKVGLKCGGSDGFSGITANPLLGCFSDFLTAQSGVTVLTEVPEMFGAETLLMNRCKTPELFQQTVNLINGFKAYYAANNQPIYENPSPGNKAGGISTLEEKSLGCTQKSGHSLVCGVVDYGEQIQQKGLNLLCAPGNDLVASTALAASGCQLILFTTGRGTPFGTFVPTVKISTNTTLFKNKSGWIDFDAGKLLDNVSMTQLCEELILFVLQVASGMKTCSEKNGYQEFAIFKIGVTL